MNYKGKNILLSGSTGFIGRALKNALLLQGAKVIPLIGDIREPETFNSYLISDYRFDYLFHFAGPSSQILFKRNPELCFDVTINGFINAARMCRLRGAKLIYPSTGLLSQGRLNEYAMAKKVMEDIHVGSGLDAMGIRIFAGYGPGEGHKRDYASVPYLFTKDLMNGNVPTIFGSGHQTRDFIYIDELVDAIMVLAEDCNEKIVDVGSGEPCTFNDLIGIICNELDIDQVDPIGVPAPEGYVKNTKADTTIMTKFNIFNTTPLDKGIQKIIKSMKPERGEIEEL